MVALRGMTIMPEMVVHFDVSREKSIAAIQEAMAGDQKIFLVAQRSIETDDPIQEDVYEVGTVGTIKQIMKLPKHIVRVLVSGETRGILKQLQQDTPYLRAEVEVIDESDLVIQDDLNGEAMARSLKDTFLDYAARNGKMSKEAVAEILEIKSLKKLVDEIAANTPFYYVDQQEILGKVDFWERYETLAFKLVNEVQIMDIKDELQQKVKERVDKHQKEYILREQLKLIREELGDDSTLSDAEEFEKAAKNLKAPKEVKEKLKKEISRFKSSLNSPAESGVIRTYIETLLEMPCAKLNEYLAGKRAQALTDYITSHTALSPSLFEISNIGVAWNALRALVADSDMAGKQQVLNIIDTVPVWDATKNVGRLGLIMQLNQGKTYEYMKRHFFPKLRNAGYIKVFYEAQL